QLDIEGNGLALDSASTKLKKCLPDNFNKGELTDLLNLTTPLTSLGYNDSISVGGTNYLYRGPFRPLSASQWEIKTKTPGSNSSIFFDVPDPLDTALFEAYPAGIFQKSGSTNATDIESGIGSFLFPRRGKMELQSGVEYYGSEDFWGDTI